MGLRMNVMVAATAVALLSSDTAAAADDESYLILSISLGALGIGTAAVGAGLLAASAGELSEARDVSEQLYATGQRSCYQEPRCDEINELLVDSDNYFNAGLGVTIGGAAVVALATAVLIKGAAEGKLASVRVEPVITAEGAFASAKFEW